MDFAIDPQPGAQSAAWLAGAQIPAELLTETIEALQRVGCQFFGCDGPTLTPEDMVTCYVCDVLAKLRVAAGRPARSEDDGPTRAERSASWLARETHTPAPPAVTWDELQVGQVIYYKHYNRSQRLAGRDPIVRRGLITAIYPPNEETRRVNWQVSIRVLKKDNTMHALGSLSITRIDMVVGIESQPTTVVDAGTGGGN